MMDFKATKSEIIDSVYTKTNLTRYNVKFVCEMFFTEISAALVAGRTVELRGFGTFEPVLRKARKSARDPRTGETVEDSARKTIKFRPGRELKLSVRAAPEVQSPCKAR